jgi:glutamate-1-semialdehyde 2,1-aminomutase
MILGHASTKVAGDVKKAIDSGFSFGTTNMREIEFAQAISDAIPVIRKIRFVNSGTEAVMGAIRLARGYTGRDKIIKFENSYHGHADYLLAKGGSGLATLGIPESDGVPRDFIKHTIIVSYGDKKSIDEIFKKHRDKIAAVIFEPCGGNYGVISPDVDFIKHLRAVTKRHGALLIADEVITGFRFSYGSLAVKLGVEPDLIVLGKIIGGGLPVGAYGGCRRIMDKLAPLGKVYQASTFAGNPVVAQAGLSTLKALRDIKYSYNRLESMAGHLTTGLIKQAAERHIELKVVRFGSIFSLKFKEKKIFREFYKGMLRRGIYFAPSEFEANFLSFSHTKKDIDRTIAAAVETMRDM